MKTLSSNELRELFLSFFEAKGAQRVPSDSLVPENDPTLLFTGAGMNQFKEQFMGKNITYRRATSCQKCIRTLDIEIVGTDNTHHTFFEMLGNFSFGDYFKKEAIQWAWEFLTRELEIEPERLWATVYLDDDEAYTIWRDEVKLPEERIRRFDADENFWPKNAPTEGPNGPCGPCSEIFYDTRTHLDCNHPDCGPNCPECERYIEVWNLVFTQFERQEGGRLDPLPSKNIDTGMGMERLTSIVQNVPGNDYRTDIFMPVIADIEKLSKRRFDEVEHDDDGVRLRRIADHVRAIAFLLCEGVRPGNEGRGYVLRRLLRRASLDGRRLGIEGPFLYKLTRSVENVMGAAYPELKERRKPIADAVRLEEEKFADTLMQGINLLNQRMEALRAEKATVLSGEDAFRLYDTYGFPLELTREMLAEEGMTLDEDGFKVQMERQREMARAGSAISEDIFALGPLAEIKGKVAPTAFMGYEHNHVQGAVVAIIKGKELVERLEAGDKAAVVLDKTSMYGEAGGQVGDTGVLDTESNDRFEVDDVQRDSGYFLHVGALTEGSLKVGSVVVSNYDERRRNAIRCNHTVTHLLHKALRSKVDTHIEQSGSLVAPDRLRFDFSHFVGLKDEDIRAIEEEVNEAIAADYRVETQEMSIEKAREAGAVALFGEKYGDVVRVVTVGADPAGEFYSRELCGGTHLDHTSRIRLFKIVNEESVAAGVRRINAVTGDPALEIYQETEQTLDELARTLAANRQNVLRRAQELVEENKSLSKEIKKIARQQATGATDDLMASATEVGGTKIVAATMEGTDMDGLRSACDGLRQKAPSTAICLGAEVGGKAQLIVALTDDLVKKGLKAGDLIKPIAAEVKGGGGGRPNMAQAGGSDPSGLDKAMAKAREVFEGALGS